MKTRSGPKAGRIFRPFATQHLPFGKLKFWLAVEDAKDMTLRRYEVSFTRGSNAPSLRFRPYFAKGKSQYSSNFLDYLVPDDVRDHPFVRFPRHKGDTIGKAAMAAFSDQQIADLTSFRLVGTVSPQPKPEPPLLPLMAHNGDRNAP